MIYEMDAEIIFSKYSDYHEYKEKFDSQEPIDFNGHSLMIMSLSVIVGLGEVPSKDHLKCCLTLKESIEETNN